jgi:peroxiredoxin Q/BCP
VCSLRDAAKDLEALEVRVMGISVDDVAAQLAFHKAQKLDFDLLSDVGGTVAKKYGVLRKGSAYSGRVTFVIDSEGKVRHVDYGVKVRSHGKDLVGVVKKLRLEAAAADDGTGSKREGDR